jgi:hypothetical protein
MHKHGIPHDAHAPSLGELILLNIRKHRVCMHAKDWGLPRAHLSGEVTLSGSCRRRSTLAAVPVLSVHAVVIATKNKQFHHP